MKKIVLVLTVALMGIAMNAQPPRQHRGHDNPEQMVQHRVEHLDKALSLTDAQKAELTKILMQEFESMKPEQPPVANAEEKPQRPDESVMKARREQMEARRAETEAKVKAVLTPEQVTKYDELKQHEGKRGHGHHHDGDRRPPKHDGCNCPCKHEQ
ncbi:MAG: Spy/CpxP family protein refolding chaperone [Muribaculaceae bacterium]|nr:Spy/CpxP family protein refolding chaperone [Muribaculaceae bacterium]MBR5685377.1 Spy/CpxP family protein refolding chaperone [Muribaculaceae bacterium]